MDLSLNDTGLRCMNPRDIAYVLKNTQKAISREYTLFGIQDGFYYRTMLIIGKNYPKS